MKLKDGYKFHQVYAVFLSVKALCFYILAHKDLQIYFLMEHFENFLAFEVQKERRFEPIQFLETKIYFGVPKVLLYKILDWKDLGLFF